MKERKKDTQRKKETNKVGKVGRLNRRTVEQKEDKTTG